jgi:hypothetical protein
MNDTTKKFESFCNNKFATVSGEEKMRMASESFEAAKKMALSSFGSMDNYHIKKNLIKRFYSQDFTDDQIEKIIS